MKVVALICVGLVAASATSLEADQRWHRVERATKLRSFDRSVLGSLKDPEAMRMAEVPRDHTFVATVDVGTPPQTMKCLLDTGSADLWLPSKKCFHCDDERHFHAELSSTFMPAVTKSAHGYLPVPVRLDYGSGDVAGFLVQDVVRLGWQSFPNQSFIIVEEEKLPPRRTWDGICGLGWRQMAKSGQPLYKSHLKEGDQAIFALVPGPQGQMFVSVGEVPHKACKNGEVTYAPAESVLPGSERSYWVASGELHVNGANGPQRPWNARFLVDSGTEFLLAPKSQYAAFLRALLPLEAFDHLCGVDMDAGGVVVCDCAITESRDLDPRGVRVVIGGRSFSLDIPKLFKRVPTAGGGELCLLQVQQNSIGVMDPMKAVGKLIGFKGPSQAEADGATTHRPPVARSASVPFTMPGGHEEDRVEVQTRQMPDGALCVTRMLHDSQGKVVSSTTTCTDPEPESQTVVRRLAMPGPEPIRSLIDAHPEKPTDNIWILGGVFLEHFVLVLDFEQNRMGFAEPAFADPPMGQSAKPNLQPAKPNLQPTPPTPVYTNSLRAVRAPRIGDGPIAMRSHAGGTPVSRQQPEPSDILSGGGVGSGQLPHAHQVGSSQTGYGVLAALAIAGAAGGMILYKKLTRPKNLNVAAAPAEMEDPCVPAPEDAAE